MRAGDVLRLTCRGRGCVRRSKTVQVRKDRKQVSLLRYIKRARLRRGAVVQLRVTQPGTIGRVGKWKIRAPKNPIISRKCLAPGAKRPTRCPS